MRPTAETEALLNNDPPSGVARHLLPRPPEVPAHFIAPPPRRIRVPKPPPQKVPIVPRIASGQKAGRRRRHKPGSLSSYGEEVPTDEKTEEERAARAEATRKLAEEAATPAGRAAEERYQYLQRRKLRQHLQLLALHRRLRLPLRLRKRHRRKRRPGQLLRRRERASTRRRPGARRCYAEASQELHRRRSRRQSRRLIRMRVTIEYMRT